MLKYVNTGIVFQEIPDEVTLAINISGCPCHCPGCHFAPSFLSVFPVSFNRYDLRSFRLSRLRDQIFINTAHRY